MNNMFTFFLWLIITTKAMKLLRFLYFYILFFVTTAHLSVNTEHTFSNRKHFKYELYYYRTSTG